MARYVEGSDWQQVKPLPECLDDNIAEDNPVGVVDAFVSELDLEALGFEGMMPAATGRPAYHPAVLLEIYIRLPRSDRVQPAVWSASASATLS